MGAPRRNRSKFEKPKEIWNLERIHADNALRGEYGLKNMKELWKVQSNISRIRGNVRELLSGSVRNPSDERNTIASLARLGIIQESAKLDDLLDVKEAAFLERRLQSIVFRKGMARSMRQSRQLITHGFIAIGGRKVSRPGYMVSSEEEKSISYYRPIDITVNAPKDDSGAAKAEMAEEKKAEAAIVEEAKGGRDEAGVEKAQEAKPEGS